MLWKWVTIGTMALGMLSGNSLARACGEKEAQASSKEDAQPTGGAVASSMGQLGSPSLQRALGLGRDQRKLTLLGAGRSPASLQASPVRLGVNPTSYRLKSFQQELPWME
jgi:hypothetical protein